MINLNETPEALLTAKSGDKFLLNNQEIYVSIMDLPFSDLNERMFLTTTNSKITEYNNRYDVIDFDRSCYSDMIQHVRIGKSGNTCFLPTTFIEAIRSNDFIIG